MLIINKIIFENIGRFTDTQQIDIQSIGHLSQIDGVNNNTGGSSGSGKSTCADALAYVFGISDKPSTHLQSRLTKEPMYVEAHCEWENNNIIIRRHKKDGLSIEFIGDSTKSISGNSKAAEEKLQEILGIPKNLLKRMCYKKQKEGGFFLNLTAKEMHNFLMECLDLHDNEKKVQTIQEKCKEYRNTISEAETKLNTIESTKNEFEELLQNKIPPENPQKLTKTPYDTAELDIQETIQVIERDKQKALSEIGDKPQALVQDVNAEKYDEEIEVLLSDISSLKETISGNIAKRETDLSQLTSKHFEIKNKLQECMAAKKHIPIIEQEIEEQEKILKTLNNNKCHVCWQSWKSEDLDKKKQEVKLHIMSLSKKLDSLKQLSSEIKKFIAFDKKMSEIIGNKKAEQVNKEEGIQLEKLQNTLQQLKSKKDSAKQSSENILLKKQIEWEENRKKIENKFDTWISQYSNYLESIKKYEKDLDGYKKECNEIKVKIQNYSKKIDELKSTVSKNKSDLLVAEESARLIKLYNIQMFNDSLDYIAETATDMLSKVPNMSSATISFGNCKTTASGKSKDEITAIINLGHEVSIPIKTLSGGERTSIDFIVDLAVSKMIEDRTKKGINIYIIDEGFDGLDSISKIECLEILKSLHTNKKIIMIDHSSEVKECVYDTILVVRDHDVSYIQ